MKIAGLQKLTLLDYPEKTACTVFTAGCNFRCPFCHNASLVVREREREEIAEEEFFAFLERRQGVLDGVCVTGGEPLLQPDLASFLKRIKDLGFSVKLDTNGSSPRKLRELIEAGLVDYVAMDIKNSREKYPMTAGVDGMDTASIEESVALLLGGAVPFEFRTTVVRGHHTPADMDAIGQWIQGAPRYFLQAYVDSGDILAQGMDGLSPDEMAVLLETVRRYIPQAELRGV